MERFLYKPNNLGNYNLIMAYPAIESFAMASLGYLWLYKIADTTEGINANRYYTDSANNLNIKNIDSIAFSMSFDFDFLGVFTILEKLKIPLYSSKRNDNSPLIFAGGPVFTTNPRPYEAFFDFMIIGDGEENFPKILDILRQKKDKETTLSLLSEIEGVYIPNNPTKKASVNLNNIIYTPIISDKSYFKDTFIIELARGCMNRCAFCTASYTNLPFRVNNFSKIIETIDMGLKYTDKIALLGAQIASHPQFNEIMKYLRNKMESGKNIELGISSLRTDSITPETIQTLVMGGQKHSTIAIEAASEHLRKFINKNLKEDQILKAIKISRENGLKGIKIYSMIGIPNETDADIEEFIRLGNLIKKENKGFNIEFSFSSFVPKPHTPLQWSKREDTKSLEKKQKYIQKELAKIGIQSKFSSIKWDFWQTVLSRGGVELAPFLVEVYKNGGNLSAFKKAQKELGLDFTKEINGSELLEAEVPWDIIEFYPTKQLLINEYNRLYRNYSKLY